MPDKFYFYVDESGQDTRGEFFVVAVVIADQDLNRWRNTCEAIERNSGKGNVKWRKARKTRLAYMRLVLETPLFAGNMTFAIYTKGQNYDDLITRTIALTIKHVGEEGKKAILVDGLSKERWQADTPAWGQNLEGKRRKTG